MSFSLPRPFSTSGEAGFNEGGGDWTFLVSEKKAFIYENTFMEKKMMTLLHLKVKLKQ